MSRALGVLFFTFSSSAIALLRITRSYYYSSHKTLTHSPNSRHNTIASISTNNPGTGTDSIVYTPEVTEPDPINKDDDACDACDQPGDVVVNDMIGSVKHYDRHVMIYTSDAQWEAKIEGRQDHFPFSLMKYIDEYKKENSDCIAIKVTAMHDASYDKGIDASTRHRFLIYPDNIILDVKETDVAQLAIVLHRPSLLDSSGQEDWKHLLPDCGLQIPSFKRLILVCIHAARDKRCGRAGPQVITELQKLCAASNIDESTIAVRGSSHIGGHQYAGTLIVYPEAQWYGRVTKSTTAELLRTIQASAVLARCSRGLIRSKLLKW